MLLPFHITINFFQTIYTSFLFYFQNLKTCDECWIRSDLCMWCNNGPKENYCVRKGGACISAIEPDPTICLYNGPKLTKYVDMYVCTHVDMYVLLYCD